MKILTLEKASITGCLLDGFACRTSDCPSFYPVAEVLNTPIFGCSLDKFKTFKFDSLPTTTFVPPSFLEEFPGDVGEPLPETPPTNFGTFNMQILKRKKENNDD